MVFKIRERTDIIPAEMEVCFGSFYMILSNKYAILPITSVWKFPKPITNKEKQTLTHITYTDYIQTSNLNYSFYLLEEHFEVIPGIWELQLFYKNELLYSRKFNLKLVQ